MKIRNQFVANSSSSSYTCDVCRVTKAGWDWGVRDAGMRMCVNDHTFCISHGKDATWRDLRDMLINDKWTDEILREAAKLAETKDEWKILYEEYEGDIEDVWHDLAYEMPAELCPLCQFSEILDRDLAEYLLKVSNKARGAILEELRERFESYEDFLEWLRG